MSAEKASNGKVLLVWASGLLLVSAAALLGAAWFFYKAYEIKNAGQAEVLAEDIMSGKATEQPARVEKYVVDSEAEAPKLEHEKTQAYKSLKELNELSTKTAPKVEEFAGELGKILGELGAELKPLEGLLQDFAKTMEKTLEESAKEFEENLNKGVPESGNSPTETLKI